MLRSSAALRRGAGMSIAALVALVGAIGLIAAMSLRSDAGASQYPPSTGCSVSTTSTSIEAGGSVTITGSGFPADSTVTLTLHSADIPLGTTQADGNGSFTDTVDIPTTVGSGSHEIVASAGDTSCSLGTSASSGVDPISVSRGGSGSGGSATSGGTAETGFAAVTATVIALVLLGGGLLFVVIGRRRSRV